MTTEQMLLTAISALAGAFVWLGRLFVADLMRQRDIAQAGWRESTAATDRLAAAIEARNARDRDSHRTGEVRS